MRATRRVALMAVGDDAWQGGIQYIINIINALNAADESGIEIHLLKSNAQKFPQLEKFDRVKIELHDVATVFEPYSFSNRVKWFIQRKFAGKINPRAEQYFLQNGYDYVYPGLFSSNINSGAWIADFQSFHYPAGADHDETRKC